MKPGPNVDQRGVNFGENMRRRRKEMGFNSKDFASFIKVSTAYIGLIERGERTPSFDTMLRICDFLSEDPNTMMAPDTVTSFQSTPTGRKKIVSKLEQKQEAAYSIIKTLDEEELNYVLKNLKNYKQLSLHLKGEEYLDEE
ncbi:MAG: helix-turn-helix transcriptional regulator [Defluviitaleaceae bacterium]|nr:helix-turn-helix transcriptional regulator [Defluviitaleaceae bacterium]